MGNVRLAEVARYYESTTVVSEISFEIPDGEFWVLVGPSGCGKSTILRMIAGLDYPSAGEIFINDRPVNALPARDRDVAMVFQNYALYPHMSVAENLAFGLKMRQVEAGKIQERVLDVAKSLDIAHLLTRKPKQLSGGQQQRVALGRAIARNPQAFLLDEPLSNLDAQLRDDTRTELKQLHQQLGITTLYVTHDHTEAMTLADQIVVLDQGKIQQIGHPQALYSHPANRMVATFLGAPPMNLLSAIYANHQFMLGSEHPIPCPPAIAARLPTTSQDREVNLELGIRPEHLVLNLSADPHPPDSATGQLRVCVTLVEPLGREILMRAVLSGEQGQSLNFIVPYQPVWPQPGDYLTLSFELDHLNVFDPSTGKRFV
jgi:multiple sugar transport system ATP-binding protein